jgi:hypothetical protein
MNSTTNVQKTASVAPSTVETIGRTGELPNVPQNRRQGRVRPHQPGVHTHIRWPEDMWSQAQAAVRPGERLVIISSTEARTEYLR